VGTSISISPDDSTLAFVGIRNGQRQVFLRRFDSFEATPVRGSVGAVTVAFSADSRELLVGMSDTSLKRFRLVDGFTATVAPATQDWSGSWLSDGRVVYSAGGSLFIKGANSDAPPTPLTKSEPGSTMIDSLPVAVPGADAIV